MSIFFFFRISEHPLEISEYALKLENNNLNFQNYNLKFQNFNLKFENNNLNFQNCNLKFKILLCLPQRDGVQPRKTGRLSGLKLFMIVNIIVVNINDILVVKIETLAVHDCHLPFDNHCH